ncbi:type 2 periplasmic-binding domain-containing protein [Parachitinimonas caeni]|uniref:Phosphate ABC transporter substrate-binding protein n=1 Tax=Parachitinimonas caeni TaxID=3031301 RepID=A0ABT7E1H9_9NEIS|nr:phosphate ABC transporter substrate-binding protein [Parachitinimonas caeni]MDK2125904.1 phosphate ABC transporter substrate-binding protein [Parachitinimonas caeni]
MMKHTTLLIPLLPLLWSMVHAETVVVVAANSPLPALTANQAADIFLGKAGTFPDGRQAVPLDLPADSAIRQDFYLKATGKTPQLLKSYWTKLIFTGQAEPPREVSDPAKLRKLVASNPGFVGYIDRGEVDGSVKIVLTLR